MPYLNDKDLNRFLIGPHRAIVTDRNDDPSVSDTPHRGRIKVIIPYLSDKEHPWWCDYAGPSHQFFSVPAVGTQVYVFFNGGNPEQPVWFGAVNTTNSVKDPPSRFRRDHPDVSGYESLNGGSKGHVLEFNDIAGERRIYLEDINNNFQEFDTELNDWNIFFAHDENREIGNDVNDTIGHDENREIGNDENLTVGNDQTEDIGNDRTIVVENNDDLTVTTGNKSETVQTGNKTTDVETGSWINTVQQEYEITGQSSALFDFQDKIEVKTQDNLEITATGDWTADVTGNTEYTITGDWKGTVTGSIEFEATTEAKIKTTLFEFNMQAAVSEWKSGTTSIVLTPASVTITVGAISQTWTSSGSVYVGGGVYILHGVDHLTHRHLTFGTPPFTGTPQA